MGTLQSLANPWMHANPDRVIIGENAGLEIKTGGAWSKGLWADDNIPDSYYIQCLHYMAVTGADRWYIAAWLGGQDFVTRRIDRREDEINELIKEEKKFWDRVQNRQPPEDGGYCFEVMSRDDVEAFAKAKSIGYGKGPWRTDFDAMAKKTLVKKVLKYAPISTDFMRAVSTDDTVKDVSPDDDMSDVIDLPAEDVTVEDVPEGVDPETGEIKK